MGDFVFCFGGYIFFKWENVGVWQWVNELNMMYIVEDGDIGRGNILIFLFNVNVNDWGICFEINVGFEWWEILFEIFFVKFGDDYGCDVLVFLICWKFWEVDGIY